MKKTQKTHKTNKTVKLATKKVAKKSVATKKVVAKKIAPITKKKVVAKKIAPITKKKVAKKAAKPVVKKKVVAKKTTTPKIVKKVAKKKTAPKKSVAVVSKKMTAKKQVAAQKSKKQPVKKTVKVAQKRKQTAATKKATKSASKTALLTPILLHNKDLHALGNGFWGNLDLICFDQISINDAMADIVYASDDTGVVVKVLSSEGPWQIDMQTDTWTNGTTKIEAPIAELKKFCAILKQTEPDSKLIPAVVLMRGTIKDEAVIENYLKRCGICLVKFDESVKSNLPELLPLLYKNFQPTITPLEGQKARKTANKSTATLKSTTTRYHILTQKQMNTLASGIATVAHTGYFPIASGTIGSLIALPIAYMLNHISLPLLWLCIIVTLFLGVWAINKFTQNKVDKDPAPVIIDEVVGQSIPFAFVIPQLLHCHFLLLGFLLFRFFDIFKFGLVKYFDRQKNAWGVMMDDVVAGLQAAFILVLLQVLICIM